MTSDILKRAAEAVEGVTPGPWRNEIRYSFIAHDNTWHVLWDVPNSTGVSLVSDTGGNTASCKNDAHFIAAARTLIPDMAAAIAERDAELKRLRLSVSAQEDRIDGLIILLAEALPWIEAQLDDPAYKPGTVRAVAIRIRAALGEKP